MFKNQISDVEEKLKEHTNFHKNKQPINFAEKQIMYERELENKSLDQKSSKTN